MGKVEEEIDRKVTLVALRSFLFGVGVWRCLEVLEKFYFLEKFLRFLFF